MSTVKLIQSGEIRTKHQLTVAGKNTIRFALSLVLLNGDIFLGQLVAQ
jgi:hypothetical protein